MIRMASYKCGFGFWVLLDRGLSLSLCEGYLGIKIGGRKPDSVKGNHSSRDYVAIVLKRLV